ncbi:ATP-binding protein [Pseudooceanicola sediminis]|nr:ATP-binding protein [Pseudooceanicola sediminis]
MTSDQPISQMQRDIRISFPSTALSVRRALETVTTSLAALSLGPEELGTVELVLAEALNNVVEHAYGEGERGWISLECTQKPDGLHFTILDEGKPMPKGIVPMGLRAPLPSELEALPEGGFGWFLIQDLSHDVQYFRTGDVNTLSFRVNIGVVVRPN